MLACHITTSRMHGAALDIYWCCRRTLHQMLSADAGLQLLMHRPSQKSISRMRLGGHSWVTAGEQRQALYLCRW